MKYYVYVHRRLKDDSIFYVGKGSQGRKDSSAGRNKHWHNTVNKHGYKSQEIAWFNDENEAYEYEKYFISLIGIKNLCNVSTGGRGSASGKKNTREHIEKVRKAHIGSKRSKETNERISNKAKERFSNPSKHPMANETINTWWSKCGKIEICTHMGLATKYGLSIENLKKVENGKNFSHKGWKVVGVRNYDSVYLCISKKTDNTPKVWTKPGESTFIGCVEDFCAAKSISKKDISLIKARSNNIFTKKWRCYDI